MKDKLDASCRMAFAAYTHDIGKLAERARIDEAMEKDAQGNTVADRNKQLYCPSWDGRYTHVHAAYTGIAIDLLESELPPLVGAEVTPFAAWKDPGTDDSLINASAMHHKPQTFLQWLIATADRLASGFERDEFDAYNRAEEGTQAGRNHYTARQLTLFEQIHLNSGQGKQGTKTDLAWRYPLAPASVASLFPVQASECEYSDNKKAQAEYRRIWDGFKEAVKTIPKSHRGNWSLWLDHFDSLWATYAASIPSATAGKTKPEVSLYDHSRTTAALATALWRFHETDEEDTIREQLRAQWDRERQHQDLAEQAWNDDKFLLVIGDFFGIQPFIFANGGETQKNAAKLLRGRSAYVSLLTECAALKILDELALPPTSQVINAAGKFLIVAPNLPEVRDKLSALQREFDQWFLQQTWGESGIGIAWEPAACTDFVDHQDSGEPPFRRLIDRLFKRLEEVKARRLSLCSEDAPAPVFGGFLDTFDNTKGACAIDGRSPATEPMPKAEGKYICKLALDQINTGKWLTHYDRILISDGGEVHNTLQLDIFGYRVSFTGSEEASGKFGALAAQGKLRRAWDYSLAREEGEVLFHGYARRNINAWVPLMGDANAWEADRYQGIEEDVEWDARAPKSLEHIARDDRWLDEKGHWNGTEALMVLKGDVDNLGHIFEQGLKRPSFAKWASLSRQMNAFFAVYLPYLCRKKYPSTYTVFAGGDDFFLIGSWKKTIELAREMRQAFSRYVAQNPEIHFSVGLLMTKPGMPVRQLGEMAEAALEHAKSYGAGEKNAVTLFGETVSWNDFDSLCQVSDAIRQKDEEFGLSTGYLYRLQELAEMAQNLKSDQPKPENAIWRSWFSYRTWRMLERMRGLNDSERKRRMQELASIISEPIEQHGSRFRIPLYIHLYQQRS